MQNAIWLFWENPPGQSEPPAYVQLCWKIISKHCGNDFDIYLVTPENVKQFLPNIPDSFFKIAQINNKSNYLRYHLLAEHGGIWLDSDLVLFKSLFPMFELLRDGIDLIATASPSLKYGEPESGLLVSEPKGKIITKAAAYIDHMLELHPEGHVFQWGSLGPAVIRHAVRGQKYHHLDCKMIMPIASWNAYLFDGIECLDKYSTQEVYGFMLYHQMFKQTRSPILNMTEQQLLNSSTLIGQIFRKAMNI
jgi:hypothetical protein